MTLLLKIVVAGQTGVGAIELGTFVTITAIMVMFVVETVASRS